MNSQVQENDKWMSSEDDGDFSASSEAIEGYRHMYPSILNKSSMHSVSLSGNMMDEMPDLPQNTQKLDLARNCLTSFPLNLLLLKEIRLSHNLIERIPEEVNDISSLTILRLSHNRIKTLPYLKHVRHLELTHNPIKVITTRLSQTRLQFLSFDWIPFLVDPNFHDSDRDVVVAIAELVEAAKQDPLAEFIEFHLLISKRKTKHSLTYFMHKAIVKGYDFFITYLRDYHSHINFNECIFLGVPLLQLALEEPNPLALELFVLRKSNLSEKSVYLMNLLLACQFANLKLFNFIVGLKRRALIEAQDEVIDTIMKYFHPNNTSSVMLEKVLRYCNYTPENPKVFKMPPRCTLSFSDSIGEAILHIMNSDTLSPLIDFTQSACSSSDEPLLHFATAIRNPELVREVLKRYKSPFIKSNSGKSARSIRGSAISRKMIWKMEKQIFDDRIKNSEQEETVLTNRSGEDKWLGIMFGSDKEPIKKQQAQKVQIGLMGYHIQTNILGIENKRDKIKLLGSSRRKKAEAIHDQITKDATGILMDAAINYSHNRTLNYEKLLEQSNSLALYEAFQDSAKSTIEHDYTKRKVEQGFFISPLRLCQDVEEVQDEKEYIIVKENGKESVEGQSLYPPPCLSMFSPESPQAAFV